MTQKEYFRELRKTPEFKRESKIVSYTVKCEKLLSKLFYEEELEFRVKDFEEIKKTLCCFINMECNNMLGTDFDEIDYNEEDEEDEEDDFEEDEEEEEN